MTIYFTIKSSITAMQLKHRVYHFLTANNVWINNKQIQEDLTMDAAIIFQCHNTLDNRHSLYGKIMKVLDQLELDKDITSVQQQVLTKLQQITLDEQSKTSNTPIQTNNQIMTGVLPID